MKRTSVNATPVARVGAALAICTILAGTCGSAFADPHVLEGKFGRAEVDVERPSVSSVTLRRADGSLEPHSLLSPRGAAWQRGVPEWGTQAPTFASDEGGRRFESRHRAPQSVERGGDRVTLRGVALTDGSGDPVALENWVLQSEGDALVWTVSRAWLPDLTVTSAGTPALFFSTRPVSASPSTILPNSVATTLWVAPEAMRGRHNPHYRPHAFPHAMKMAWENNVVVAEPGGWAVLKLFPAWPPRERAAFRRRRRAPVPARPVRLAQRGRGRLAPGRATGVQAGRRRTRHPAPGGGARGSERAPARRAGRRRRRTTHGRRAASVLRRVAQRRLCEQPAPLHVRQPDGRLAVRLRVAYNRQFYEAAKGRYIWWIGRDGKRHDYNNPLVQANAVLYGIADCLDADAGVTRGPGDVVQALRDSFEAAAYFDTAQGKHVDYIDSASKNFAGFRWGIPCNLEPVPAEFNFQGYGEHEFPYYCNGGIFPQDAVAAIAAFRRAGMADRADVIRREIYRRQHEGIFPNGSGFYMGVVNLPGRCYSIVKWDGTPTDYEGIISRDCSFLQITALADDPARPQFDEAARLTP